MECRQRQSTPGQWTCQQAPSSRTSPDSCSNNPFSRPRLTQTLACLSQTAAPSFLSEEAEVSLPRSSNPHELLASPLTTTRGGECKSCRMPRTHSGRSSRESSNAENTPSRRCRCTSRGSRSRSSKRCRSSQGLKSSQLSYLTPQMRTLVSATFVSTCATAVRSGKSLSEAYSPDSSTMSQSLLYTATSACIESAHWNVYTRRNT